MLTYEIKKKIDKIVRIDIAGGIKELFTSKKMIDNVYKEINVPTNFSLGVNHCINAGYTRSFSSSLGSNFQKAATKIAVVSGWSIVTDEPQQKQICLNGFYSDETRLLIDDIMSTIEISNKDNPLHPNFYNDCYTKITDKVLATKGKPYSKKADIIISRNINGKTEIANIELKLGGDLDKGKAVSQKRLSFELFALLVSKFKDQVRDGSVEIKNYFATVYNKTSLEAGSEDWYSPSVTKNFPNYELLIGKDFWKFICLDDKNAFEYVMSCYDKHCTPEYKRCMRKLKKDILEGQIISESNRAFYERISYKK